MININAFIADHITRRHVSLLQSDIKAYHDKLETEIADKSVLVIGGAGSIGSSFIKALLRHEPARLYVIDISENGLTELTRDLRSTYGLKVPEIYKTYPINFGSSLFEYIIIREGPFDIVANFAAHKHVRSEKDHYSITALLENNVLKAVRLLERLKHQPPQHFFCVSTDKATNPVNIMGASKKIMEKVIMSYSMSYPVTTARFANVAFSNGSLLDGFVSRMMKRQPLSAPRDIKRYFVSPKESGEICLLASIVGSSGDIFFPKLDVGQMMTFSEIALRFLHAQGLSAEQCDSEEEAKKFAANRNESSRHYPVYFFDSDTCGEKPFEEFFADDEEVDLESFMALGVIKNGTKQTYEEVHRSTRILSRLLAGNDTNKNDIVEGLQSILPNFHHIETGRHLDQRM